MFESGYTRELIRLGYRDAMHRREELESFMRGDPVHAPGGIIGWRDLSQEYTARHKILKISGQE